MTVEEQQNQNPDALSEGKRIRRNYIYNLIYQIFLILVPTVITPYVARVLGDDGSGQYSFCYSLVTYFILFASLGFGFYAQRLVAKHQGDKRQQTIDFWEVILARAVPAALTLAVYLGMIFVGVYDEKYRFLMLVMVIEVAAVLFDIAFFFQGNEEFGKMVLRNVLVKTIGFASIFLFVREMYGSML